MKKLQPYQRLYNFDNEDVTETLTPLLAGMRRLAKKTTNDLLWQICFNDAKVQDCLQAAYMRGLVVGLTCNDTKEQ